MLGLILALLSYHPVPPHEQFVVQAPRAMLTLLVARTEAQREFGLMNRHILMPHTGMVFVFSRDGAVAFWMKDTLIPLDMVFVGKDGRVRKVFHDVRVVKQQLPDDQIPLEAGNAQYVIELPANEAAADGIVSGTLLTPLTALSTNQ